MVGPARATARLARRRGSQPAPAVVAPRAGAPSIVDFAIENAVEGCVRESFGALVATLQAERATDPHVAGAMRRIARDETRHAALAWAIAGFAAPRLGSAERGRVRAAARAALASLRNEVAALPAPVASELGIPIGAEARALVDAFAAARFGMDPSAMFTPPARSGRTAGCQRACPSRGSRRTHPPEAP